MISKSVSIQLLDDAELSFYETNGFVAPGARLFGKTEVDKLNALIRPMIDHNLKSGEPLEFNNLINKNPDFLDFILQDKVLDMIEKIIGPDIALKESSAITKLAHSKTNFQWHSDFNFDEYWEEIAKIKAAVLVVAVTPCTKASGCIQFIPGTHRVQSKRKLSPPKESFSVVHLSLAPGYCSLHDVHVLHKSDPNESDQDRVLLTFRFISTNLEGLRPEAAMYLKKVSVSPIHLRGEDRSALCLYSLAK